MPANVTSLSEARSPDAERGEIARRFTEVRGTTRWLSEPLSAEDQQVQSMTDASPTKWHLAHTTWFFETFLLRPFARGYGVFDPDYGYLFNSYYQAVGPRHPRPRRGMLTRPPLEDVHRYRDHVDAAMLRLIEEADEETWARAAPLAELGLNHEQQHQELILTDIKHAFWCNPLRPAYRRRPHAKARAPGPMAWTGFGGGVEGIGHEGNGFAFDNEGPRHEVVVQPFRLASRLVTNGEYLTFMEDGGYARPEFWLSDGWDTVSAEGWTAPLYWEKRDGEWWELTLAGPRPVDPAEPICHVSFYEAAAFAAWAGKRLPRETEWEVAARERNTAEGNLLDSNVLHPLPCDAAAGTPAQLFGDVWEWTQSAYSPYPGYRPPPGAVGEYNGKFMCNQMVLRGGSCATPPGHIRATYRNFFPPAARWQFSGIRLADDA